MNAACSKILDEMAVFADLGTDPAQGEQTAEGFVVRLFRNGDELALVFSDDGDGKVIERCRGANPRTHASYLALLASERFGNLRSWAFTQATLLGTTAIQPAIRVEGAVAGGDTMLVANGLDDFLQSSEREGESVQVLLIDGPAGIGKTKFIEALALARASSYRRRRHPLVLHVQSRGRVLSYLQDLIAFSLQRLRLSVTFDQLPILARHGLVTLAIDGFDELGDPDGYDLAWSQVNQTIDDLRGAGTLILAGRETFIGLDRLKKTLRALRPHDVVHGLTLRPPSPEEAQRWLLKKDWTKGDVEKISYLLEPDSYALRPFFLAKLAEAEITESVRDSSDTSLLPILVNLMVERESEKFGDAVERVLSAEQRRQYADSFFCEVAQYMADDQTDIIGEIPLTWMVDMALQETVDDPDVVNLLKNRAGVMAFLAEDDLPGFRRFSHSQLFNYFLSAAAIAFVSEGEIPKYVRRNIFSADFLAVFVEVFRRIANETPGDAMMFFEHAQEWAKNYRSIDRGARNLGAWIIAVLPTIGEITDGSGVLDVGPVEADETTLRGTASPTTLGRVSVSQIDIRGADLRELTFEECALATAIVDDSTRVPRTFPIPKCLRVQRAADGLSGEDLWDPLLIGQWLDSHGRALTEDGGQVVNERHEEMLRLLGRACRSSFWIPKKKGETKLDKFVNNPLWPTILGLLHKHGHVVEKRKGAKGTQSQFVHVRQPFRILVNDPTHDGVRQFHDELARVAKEET